MTSLPSNNEFVSTTFSKIRTPVCRTCSNCLLEFVRLGLSVLVHSDLASTACRPPRPV